MLAIRAGIVLCAFSELHPAQPDWRRFLGPRRQRFPLCRVFSGGFGQNERVPKIGLQFLFADFFFPAADHDGGDTVPNKVGKRSAFAHEPVDTDDQRQRLNRDARDDRQGSGSCDKSSAGHAGGAF